MKKLFWVFCVLCVMTVFLPVKAEDQISEGAEECSLGVETDADFVYVYDPETEQILMDRGSEEQIYPASMTKLMTALTAADHISDWSETVTVTEDMLAGLYEAGASVCGYSVGMSVSLDELLHGALMVSGADAVNALAVYASGSIEAFVEEMNAKAESLGMSHTHFVNPTGLHDDNHYSTCRDIALLLKTCLENEKIRDVLGTVSYDSQLGTWTNMGFDYAITGYIGGKTGYTPEAGMCLAYGLEINGMNLLAVTAHGEGSYGSQFADAVTISSYLAENWKRETLYEAGDVIGTVKAEEVIGSHTEEVTADADIVLDVPEGCAAEVQIPDSVWVTGEDQIMTAYIDVTWEDKLISETALNYTVGRADDVLNRILCWFRGLFA